MDDRMYCCIILILLYDLMCRMDPMGTFIGVYVKLYLM